MSGAANVRTGPLQDIRAGNSTRNPAGTRGGARIARMGRRAGGSSTGP